MEEILLHCCCGPCTIYPIAALREMGFCPTGFFFNPNIHPEEELSRRKEGFLRVGDLEGVLTTTELDQAGREDFIKEAEADFSYGARCKICYRMRLERTAAKAKEIGLGKFSTTLLVSPYQLHDEIRIAGETAALKHGVEFLYADFRSGFREGQRKARALGIYMQKYCGCAWSLKEREKEASRDADGV